MVAGASGVQRTSFFGGECCCRLAVAPGDMRRALRTLGLLIVVSSFSVMGAGISSPSCAPDEQLGALEQVEVLESRSSARFLPRASTSAVRDGAREFWPRGAGAPRRRRRHGAAATAAVAKPRGPTSIKRAVSCVLS